MTALTTTLTIVHVVISLALIVVVLLQQSKQQSISGAIIGASADTFFGKNKGRTVDAMLKKVTAVLAILFIVSSVVLAILALHPVTDSAAEADPNSLINVEDVEGGAEVTPVEGEGTDAEGEAADTTADADADTEGEAADTTADADADTEGEAADTTADAE